MSVQDLSRLREEIAHLDRALIELLGRRMEVAAELGRVKAASGDPLLFWDVEDRALRRAREQAEACGVSETVMEEIFRAVLKGSVQRQHRVGLDNAKQSGHRVLVIGAAGGMGSWFRRFLERSGHRVDLVDPVLALLPDAPGAFATLGAVADLDGYEAIVVAVPLAAAPAVLEEVLARAPRGLVVEITSIKSPQVALLERARAAGRSVCALHPMFGPGKSPYETLTFVVGCLDDSVEERRRVEGLLAHPYAQVVTIPLRHHDRLMGWLLGLAHLTGMVFASALARSGLAPAELAACASTTFLRQASTATSILNEDPGLYLDIQRLNPHRAEVYRATREALEELVGLVEAGDREGFRRCLETARRAVTGEG